MEQVVANGLYLGAQYALIALGLTLIFALMNVLNFAHGQMYVLGGFVTYTIYGQFGLPFVLALAASAVTLAVVGALIEKFLFGPVIKKSQREESTMLLAAGLAFLLDVRIPGQADHRFRRKPITHSDSSRSPIPDEPDQRFRSQADHFSAMTGIVPGVRCEGARGAG